MQEIAHRPLLFQELDITDEAALQELFRKVREELQCPGRLVESLAGVGAGRKGSAPLLQTMEPPGWLNRAPGGVLAGSCRRGTDALCPLQHQFSAVMHFAGLKAVGESVQKPLEYYRVNLTGTIRLLEVRGAAILCWSLCSPRAQALPWALPVPVQG